MDSIEQNHSNVSSKNDWICQLSIKPLLSWCTISTFFLYFVRQKFKAKTSKSKQGTTKEKLKNKKIADRVLCVS